MRQRFALVVGIALTLCVTAARSQVIDSVDVTRDGANARISIRFATQIQYLRHAPLDHGMLVQVYFQFIGADESALSTREQRRRSPPNALMPRFDVTYIAPIAGTQRRIDIKFASPTAYTLRSVDSWTISLLIPLAPDVLRRLGPAAESIEPPRQAAPSPAPAEAAPTSPSTQATTPAPEVRADVEADAGAAMAQAQEALGRNDFETAVSALNRVLNLPPNRQSQQAQELIGLAREKLGEFGKARIEDELYLKLYPDGAGAARVRERLANLGAANGVAAQLAAPAEHMAPQSPYSAWGSVSQFYYGGQSRIDQTNTIITPATGATSIETNQLTATDQSQVITTADLTGRWRDGPWDNRVVFRDAHTWSFLSGGSNTNRLDSLYAEARYQPTSMLARLGRQIGTSGGVLGRFDGGLFNWEFRPQRRLGFVAGRLVDSLPGVEQTFAGASIDIDNILPNTTGELFGIYQRVAGTTDRVGLGGEVRYFDAVRSAYGLFDYDPMFRAVNVVSLQGTWQFPAGTALNVLADYRRTPMLQLANVVLPEQTSDIGSLLGIRGASALRDEARAFTPISKVFLVGVTQPVGSHWQFGLDLRLSSLTGTPATAVAPATPGTGNIYTYTAQLIGTSLTRYQDILVFNGSVLHGSLLDGSQLSVDYRFNPLAVLAIEPSFRYYHQTDNIGGHLTRLTPAMRVVYQLRERFSIEGEYDFERTRSSSSTTSNLEQRHFFYLGWRWDF